MKRKASLSGVTKSKTKLPGDHPASCLCSWLRLMRIRADEKVVVVETEETVVPLPQRVLHKG